MAISEIHNIKIKAISSCVPEEIKYNVDYFSPTDYQKFKNSVGVEKRHVVQENQCTSDLCFKAATEIFKNINIETENIEVIIFVSHTADYKLPATACILQNRLKLSKNCIAFDVTLGCSGFPYGMNIISSLMSVGKYKNGLLLIGNTQSKYTTPSDKSVYPLFADSGSAILLEYDENAPSIYFDLGTDGSGFEDIIVPDGGSRNPVKESSFIFETDLDGNKRNRLHEKLDGINVFTFGISRAPKSILSLLSHLKMDVNSIDYLLLHQANKLMTEKIIKKVKIDPDKCPTNISKFGNTSGGSIPLLIVTELSKLNLQNKTIVASGFGVGLSWGTMCFELEGCQICELQTLKIYE
jgi:3-oxoacyl-[acyl-carrier-protein] synthase-3